MTTFQTDITFEPFDLEKLSCYHDLSSCWSQSTSYIKVIVHFEINCWYVLAYLKSLFVSVF